jgi:hypothetical protein
MAAESYPATSALSNAAGKANRKDAKAQSREDAAVRRVEAAARTHYLHVLASLRLTFETFAFR